MGKCLADMLNSTLAVLLGSNLVFYQSFVNASHAQNFPSPQRETQSHLAPCLQGGGVFVQGGSVTIDSCTISGNAASVSVHVQKFPCPHGNMADMPRSTLIFHNSDRYLVLSGNCTCQPRLQTSHRPNGKIADVLAPTQTCTTAIMLRSTTGGMCHRDLAKFPSPR